MGLKKVLPRKFMQVTVQVTAQVTVQVKPALKAHKKSIGGSCGEPTWQYRQFCAIVPRMDIEKATVW